jgi:FdhE protein
MPFKVTDTVDPIIQRLRSLVKEFPELNNAAHVYEAILPLLRDADLHVGTISITTGQVRQKMASDIPLLSDLGLDFDADAARALMINLAAVLEKAGRVPQPFKLRLPWLSSITETDSAARRIRTALEENTLEAGSLLSYVASGNNDAVASVSKDLGLDPGLTVAIAQNALKPALREWCRQLAPLAKGIPWHKSTCFMCGAVATLAELQENDQVKHLRCGQCGADWQFPRLQCMYCGNEDHRTLKYLYPESHLETRRVEVCDKCHGYLKVITSFAPTSPEMLTVTDLSTLQLDSIAETRGYKHGVVL